MTDYKEKYNFLLKERERLQKDLEDLKATLNPTDERREGSPFGKREEEATQVIEMEKAVAREKQLLESMCKVNHAIEKYEAGTYGICDQCGKQIQSGRLEALPYAAFCIECKAKQSKNIGGGSVR